MGCSNTLEDEVRKLKEKARWLCANPDHEMSADVWEMFDLEIDHLADILSNPVGEVVRSGSSWHGYRLSGELDNSKVKIGDLLYVARAE